MRKSLAKLKSSEFVKQAKIFSLLQTSKDCIIKAGERALVCLYNGKVGISLDQVCNENFCEKVARRVLIFY